MIDGYFIGKTGKRYDYGDIARRIQETAPETLGKHISVQLEAIGLLEEMEGGSTPCGLPFTFASKLIQKELTSNGLVHTPGIFRALQNDYNIAGKTRRQAIQILSTGYQLSKQEAEGILSGAIKTQIDDSAGTISFIVPA